MLANWGLLEKEEGKGCRPTHMHFPYDIFLFVPLFLFLHKCISEHSSQSSEEYRRFLAHSSGRRWQQKNATAFVRREKLSAFLTAAIYYLTSLSSPKDAESAVFFSRSKLI